MRQSFTPGEYVPTARANAADAVFHNAAQRPDHVAFLRPVGDQWRAVTAARFADEVTRLAAGLIANDVRPGDRVALMGGTSYEWMRCDFAIWAAGAVTVPIYETSAPSQVEWLVADSGATAAFVQDGAQAAVVGRKSLAGRVWRMDPDGLEPLLRAGQPVPDRDVRRRRRAAGGPSPATIVYTSGTTGRPKGCMITHHNLLAEVRSVLRADGVIEKMLTKDASVLLFLPLAHILARVVQLAAVHNGTLLGHSNDLKNLPARLRDFQPTVVLGVPRVFETFHHAAARAAAGSAIRARLFQAAERAAIAYSQAGDHGGPGARQRATHRIFDRLVYTKLRAALGGRARYAVSGGAPLDTRLGHFLRGAGITVLEGWGLTETTAAITLNLPDAHRIGTVGRPLPGCAVRVADDGEILVSGDAVFAGYWHDPAATAEALDGSWLRTGDLGRLDADGFLVITGRKKDIIITAGGKNVTPGHLEDRLRQHWLIEHCVVVGDRRPYIGALIAPDEQAFDQWKRANGKPASLPLAQLRDDSALLAALQAPVDEVNATVSRAEAIRRIRVLPRPFAVGDELTPTQKVRRAYVLAAYAEEVEALYALPKPDHVSR